MYFEPYGPFDLREALQSEDRFWRNNFWAEVDSKYPGLSLANGIYIFSLEFSGNYMPWYVGKTCSAKGFSGEIFQDHKLSHYQEVVQNRRGREYVHFIARVEENRGDFCRSSEASFEQIEQVETYLIGMALAKNANLRNDKKTGFFKELDIAGVIGPKYNGRPREDARTLKNLLGLALP